MMTQLCQRMLEQFQRRASPNASVYLTNVIDTRQEQLGAKLRSMGGRIVRHFGADCRQYGQESAPTYNTTCAHWQ